MAGDGGDFEKATDAVGERVMVGDQLDLVQLYLGVGKGDVVAQVGCAGESQNGANVAMLVENIDS